MWREVKVVDPVWLTAVHAPDPAAWITLSMCAASPNPERIAETSAAIALGVLSHFSFFPSVSGASTRSLWQNLKRQKKNT